MAQAVTIPANDLKRPFELHADAYEQKALEVLRSGWYILGKEVSAFEQAFAAYLGAHCCVGLASGLDSLWMAFRLLGIGPGDEVIVCANAYIACVMGIDSSRCSSICAGSTRKRSPTSSSSSLRRGDWLASMISFIPISSFDPCLISADHALAPALRSSIAQITPDPALLPVQALSFSAG